MAANDSGIENIEIRLETNWDTVLSKSLGQYTNFVKETGNIARGAEKGFTDLAKGIATNMSSIFGETSKQVTNTMNQGRILMRNLMSESVKASQLHLQVFDQLDKQQKKYQRQLQKSADAAKKLKKAAEISGSKKDITKANQAAAAHEAYAQLLDKRLKMETDKIMDKFAAQLGQMSKKAAKNVADITRANLKAVNATAEGALGEFRSIQKKMENESKSTKMFSQQAQIEEMKAQYKNLHNTLRQQAKLTAQAERQVLNAERALRKSISAETIEANEKVLRSAIANEEKVKKGYQELEKEVYDYAKAIGVAEEKTRQMARELQKGIARSAGADLTGRMKAAMNNLVEYAKLSGKGMSTALTENMAKTRFVEKSLSGSINKLKEMRKEAIMLQKTGFVDTRNEVSKIDRVLDKYQSFWNEYKQQQKLMQDLSKRRVASPTAGVSELVKVQKQYQELANEARRFGKVNVDNMVEANQMVTRLSGVWDQYVAKRKQVVNRTKSIQKEMHDVELMMQKTSNKELIAQFENYRNELKGKLNRVKKQLAEVWKPPAEIKNVFNSVVVAAENAQKRVRQQYETMFKKDFITSDVTRQMKSAMDLLVDYAQNAGFGMREAIVENLRKTKGAEEAIQKTVAKLKEMRAEAVRLKNTGLVDTSKEISSIDRVIAKYNQFQKEFKEQQALVQRFAKQKIDIPVTGLGDLAKMQNSFKSLAAEARNFGRVNEDNLLEAHQLVNKLQKTWDQYVSKRKEVVNRTKAIRKEMHDVELMMQKTSNKELLNEMAVYHKQLETKLKSVKRKLAEVWKPPAGIRTLFDKVADEAAQAQTRIRNHYNKTKSQIVEGAKKVENAFNEVNVAAEKISKKRFISTDAVTNAKKQLESVNEKFNKYKEILERVQQQYRELVKLQNKGLAGKGTQQMLNDLKRLEEQMKKNIRTIRDRSIEASKSVNKLQSASTKSLLRSSWEAIRNFRWQVAAVIYLISRAVMALKNTVLQVLKNVQKFRMDSMSLAASFAMQMIGGIEETYGRAVKYARNLMVKLELTAAKTILTMEDMLMLTKTLAQAGFIPETDEDVRNIATIGTAIKALTEGMANAGVQMRQELYAIIAGRQRATDQLAMMFKFIGINIQEVIDKTSDGSVTMVQALASALEPFNEMNRQMENEYSAVINRLQVIWGILQRVAAETILLDIAKDLRKLADSLAIITEKSGLQLTQLGKNVAFTLGATLEDIKFAFELTLQYGKYIIEVLGNISELLVSAFGGLSGHGKKMQGIWRGVAATFEFIAKTSVLFIGLLKGMQVGAKGLFSVILMINDAMKEMAGLVYNVWTGQFKAAWNNIKGIAKSTKHVKDGWDEFWKAVDEVDASLADVDRRIKNIYKTMKGIKYEDSFLGQLLKVPFPKLNTDIDKLTKRYETLKTASLTDSKKIEWQFELDTKGLEDTRRKLLANIEASEKALNAMFASGVGNEQFRGVDKIIKIRLQGYREQLEMLEKTHEMAVAKRDKELQELTDRQMKAYARAVRQWETFINELRDRPESRSDKLEKWYKQQVERVKELIRTNQIGAREAQRAWDALSEGYYTRMKQNLRDLQSEMQDLTNTITSHEVLSEYEKIGLEFDKIYQKIRDNVDLNDIQKFQYMEMAYLAKGQRIEIQKLADAEANRIHQMDTLTMMAKYMQDAYSPITQRQGEQLELYAETQKQLAQISYQMQEIERKHKDSNNQWTLDSKYAQEHFEMLRQQYKLTQATFEREIWRKQHPMWQDMIDMSESWADGLGDSLTDLVLDFENFADSIKSLWESILRDATKALIKRQLIEPMMGALGSGEPGSPTPWERITGGGADVASAAAGVADQFGEAGSATDAVSAIINAGEPIPVYIVDPIPDLGDDIDKTTRAIKETGEANKQAVENGFQQNGSTLSGILSALWSKTSESAGNLISGIASLWGGGAGGMNTGAPAHIGAGGTYAFGMADGGTIDEHIVGTGLKSGRIYEFGERARYGEFEDVVPQKRMMNRGMGSNKVEFHMPVSLNALDSRTGVEFIMQNFDAIERKMARSIKNNRGIRSMIRRQR